MKIGLFGIGLEAYWEQFEGLKARLEGYLAVVEQKLTAMHPPIINLGLIDTTDKAFAAGAAFRKEDVDLIFLYVTTYALSSTVLPVVQRTKVPVIVLNLAPEAAIDYVAFNQLGDRTKMTGEWLAHCSACPVPEIANVFNRTGIKFHQVKLKKAARTSVVLDNLVKIYKLGSMAYYYKGTGNIDNEDTINSIILGNSLLTANGIPVAGEYEIKNAQAMKIMDSFGAGGSFTEYYAVDFNDDVILMGHDGPGHMAIADGKCKVKPLTVYHGKSGQGLSVEMSVKKGPVTLLSVLEQQGGKLMMLIAEGESVAGPILEIGNTNSRYKFPIGTRRFMNQWNSHGPAHHCAVGLGHISSKIHKLGQLINMEVVKVC